jgi:hypothetical protein
MNDIKELVEYCLEFYAEDPQLCDAPAELWEAAGLFLAFLLKDKFAGGVDSITREQCAMLLLSDIDPNAFGANVFKYYTWGRTPIEVGADI